MRGPTRRAVGMIAAVAVSVGGLVATAPTAAAATDPCQTLSAPIHRTINPFFRAQLLTPWQGESAKSKSRYGFTDDRGVFGYASPVARPGLVPVTRLYHPGTVDFIWLTGAAEITQARKRGYVSFGPNFYAQPKATSCNTPVHRFVNGEHTRNVWTAAEAKTLTSAGWRDQGVSFYLKAGSNEAPLAAGTAKQPSPSPSPSVSPSSPPSSSPSPSPAPPVSAAGADTFSIAVIADTQAETNSVSNTPFLNRTNWMAANKDKLDLRYVLHTGDMTNWGWLDPAQLTRARAAMDVLKKAGLPYSLTVGNHDTAAVGWDGVAGSTKYGGAAYMSNPECPTRIGAANCKSWLLVRQTAEFNQSFPLASMGNLGGYFEAGKVDNHWTSFQANNTKWLVLTLEPWPRKTAVAWAKNVVASHPDHNVIIQTHHYLDSNGKVSGSNGGYGETPASYLYDQIVSKYSNVKLIFSGHTGKFTHRTDQPGGNTVVSYLGNDLGANTNPVRIVNINTKTGTVTTTVHNPIQNNTAGTTNNTITIIK